jgi:hypothetical protein
MFSNVCALESCNCTEAGFGRPPKHYQGLPAKRLKHLYSMPKEDLGQLKSKTKMRGAYIDFGSISDPVRVCCHPKSENYKYPVGFWSKGGKNMNVASIRGWLLVPTLL